jgi:hypothetical protein
MASVEVFLRPLTGFYFSFRKKIYGSFIFKKEGDIT